MAFSIIITFAFGKSIPTSIIVVETSILNSLFKNLFNIFSFSSMCVFPCNNKTLSVKIPAGVEDGMQLKVSGKGNESAGNGIPGDLIVLIQENEHPNLKREGINIYSEISVSYLQAILGDTVDIMTVDGKVNLKIPSGTQPNSTLSLENKGVPRLGNPVARGNHQVLVKVKLPTRITDDERNLLEDLASKYTEQNSSSNSGLFSRLFGKDS